MRTGAKKHAFCAYLITALWILLIGCAALEDDQTVETNDFPHTTEWISSGTALPAGRQASALTSEGNKTRPLSPAPSTTPALQTAETPEITVPPMASPFSLLTSEPPILQGPLLAGQSSSGHIVIYDVRTEQYHDLTVASAEPIGWSPDGCHLLFKDTHSRLVSTNVRILESNVIISNKVWAHPVWSPTGEWIAYQHRAFYPYQVFIVDSAGERRIQLTNDAYSNSIIGWTPDGSELIIGSRQGDIHHLRAIAVPTQIHRLLADLTFLNDLSADPSLSVTLGGHRILGRDSVLLRVQLKDEEGWSDVHLTGILETQSGEFRVLQEGVYAEFGSSWSPDGSMIAFGARNFDEDSREMARAYLMETATGNVTVLNTDVIDSQGDAYPSWNSDGSMLAVQGWFQPYIYEIASGEITLLKDDLYRSTPLLWSPRSVYGANACQ